MQKSSMVLNEQSNSNVLLSGKQEQNHKIIVNNSGYQMTESPTVLQDSNCYLYQQRDEFINERLDNEELVTTDELEEEENDEQITEAKMEALPSRIHHPRLRACTVLDPDRVFLSRHRTYSERMVQTQSTSPTENSFIHSNEGDSKLIEHGNQDHITDEEDGDDEDEETNNCIKNMVNNNSITNTTTATLIYEYGINSQRSSLSTSFDDDDDSREVIYSRSDGSTTETSDDEEENGTRDRFDVFLETREELTETDSNRGRHEKPPCSLLNAANHQPRKGRFLISREKQGFIKRKRTRPKLISNAGNPLWRSIGDCRWKSANGRLLEINPTTLSKLGEPERSMLKQLSFAKLQAFDLRCHLSYPKEGTATRKSWRPIHSLKKKLTTTTTTSDKESKRNHGIFSIPLSQVVANDSGSHSTDKKRPKRTSDSDLNTSQRFRSNTLAVESIVARSQSFHSECGEQQEGSNLVMSSISRLIESRKEFTSMEDGLQPSKRQSRLLDALSLSSSTASSLCILDRVEELAPTPPQIPNIVVRSVEYLEQHGLEVVGIFRNGGSKKRVRQMREDFDQGKEVLFDKDSNPHDVASLFKEFFRLLPDPLLTRELYKAFIGTRRVKDASTRGYVLKYLVRLLPVVNRDSLMLLLGLLAKVASCSEDRMDGDKVTFHGNKMDSRNLATLIGPNILHNIKSSNTQMSLAEDGFCAEENQLMIEVVKEMIELNTELFDVSAVEHDEVLQNVMECDPETVDYVLRKKASRTKLTEVSLSFDEEKALQPPMPEKHSRSMSISAVPSRSRLSDEIRYLLSRVKRSSEDNTAAMASRRRKLSGTRPESLRSTKTDEIEPQLAPRKALSANSSFSKALRDHHRLSGRRSSDGRKRDSGRDSGVDVTLRTTSEDDQSGLTVRVDSAEDTDLTASGRFRRSLTKSSGRGRDSAYEGGRPTNLCRLPSIPGSSIQTSVMNEEEAPTDNNSLKVHPQQIKLHHCKSVDSTTTTLADVLDQPSFVMPSKAEQKKRNISLPSYTASGVSLSITPVTPLSSPIEVSSPVEDLRWADWPKPAEIPGQETDL